MRGNLEFIDFSSTLFWRTNPLVLDIQFKYTRRNACPRNAIPMATKTISTHMSMRGAVRYTSTNLLIVPSVIFGCSCNKKNKWMTNQFYRLIFNWLRIYHDDFRGWKHSSVWKIIPLGPTLNDKNKSAIPYKNTLQHYYNYNFFLYGQSVSLIYIILQVHHVPIVIIWLRKYCRRSFLKIRFLRFVISRPAMDLWTLNIICSFVWVLSGIRTPIKTKIKSFYKYKRCRYRLDFYVNEVTFWAHFQLKARRRNFLMPVVSVLYVNLL